MKNKKILVTGSNGYLGSHMAHWLLEMGYDVLLTDRDPKSILNTGISATVPYECHFSLNNILSNFKY